MSYAALSLMLSGDRLRVLEMSGVFGTAPESIGRKGRHRRGNPRYAKYRTNHARWSFGPHLALSTLPAEMHELLDWMKYGLRTMSRSLRSGQVKGDILIGVFAQDDATAHVRFDAALLQLISRAGLRLKLDMYPASEGDRRTRRYSVTLRLGGSSRLMRDAARIVGRAPDAQVGEVGCWTRGQDGNEIATVRLLDGLLNDVRNAASLAGFSRRPGVVADLLHGYTEAGHLGGYAIVDAPRLARLARLGLPLTFALYTGDDPHDPSLGLI